MKTLIEHCQKLNINELVRSIKSELKKVKLQAKIDALGQRIDITTTPCHFGNERIWFVCPSCKKRVATLYKPPMKNALLCRKCHDLTYLKARYHRMV
ncbi:MAG: hypothetical protein PHV78_01745 [Patescibacteria group bacterium]|nr:hypothetical protein [Patescibacteria group bacterium]MDD5121126.1 hypothetical protein [Patescibacteria group bacterium]MDD5221641.1 hypothetical protein [Patescibacteria group bacterium]MDD5395955.1 hypothetical protein [Patescibacteria group bacterium]